MKPTLVPDVKVVFDLFKKLNMVPRPSWKEDKAADFICDFAKEHKLEYKRDNNNCVVIRKPATKGFEKAESIAIINHMDMVCVSEPGVAFDPYNTPIESYLDGKWLKAKGTSLGADNGIGLCMSLAALADDSIQHPALEVIATTNEEDGMTGAAGMSGDFFSSRRVINLDSEDYDTITIGSAGAYLQFYRIKYSTKPAPEKYKYFNVEISGGLGGHSGVDINKGRANANILLASFLYDIATTYQSCLVSISGGSANNAIPSSAKAVFGIDSEYIDQMEEIFETYQQKIKSDYYKNDPSVEFTIEPAQRPEHVINGGTPLLKAISHTPVGVVEMSKEMPGTVLTSNNLGLIKQEKDHFFASTYSRSFVYDDMVALAKEIARTFKENGAEIEVIMDSPAWQENSESEYINFVSDTFNDVLGWRPKKVAMHFALEGGYYATKFPGLQMASIGPKIIEPHSTSERVDITTVEDIWKVFIELLRRLSER